MLLFSYIALLSVALFPFMEPQNFPRTLNKFQTICLYIYVVLLLVYVAVYSVAIGDVVSDLNLTAHQVIDYYATSVIGTIAQKLTPNSIAGLVRCYALIALNYYNVYVKHHVLVFAGYIFANRTIIVIIILGGCINLLVRNHLIHQFGFDPTYTTTTVSATIITQLIIILLQVAFHALIGLQHLRFLRVLTPRVNFIPQSSVRFYRRIPPPHWSMYFWPILLLPLIGLERVTLCIALHLLILPIVYRLCVYFIPPVRTQSRKRKVTPPSAHLVANVPTESYGYTDTQLNHLLAQEVKPAPFVNSGFIFEKNRYKNVNIPRWMQHLTYESIPSMLGSFNNQERTSFANEREAQEWRESKRRLRIILHTWDKTLEGTENLRDWLIVTYVNFPDVLVHDKIVYPTLPQHKYEYDRHVHAAPLRDADLVHTTKRSGKITEPRFRRYGEPGPIFDVVENLDQRSNFLPMKKVRSMLRQMISENRSEEEIRSVFVRKCYVWKENEMHPDTSKLSWIVPYIPPYWLGLHGQQKDVLKFFRQQILDIRKQVLHFVNVYYTVSTFTARERKEYKDRQVEEFKTFMRSPEAQQLFAMGCNKEFVVKYCYENKVSSLSLKNDPIVKERRVKKIYRTGRLRSKQRDEKRLNQEFETQSLQRMEFVCTWLGTLLGFLIALLYIITPYWNKLTIVTQKATEVERHANRIAENTAYWRTFLNGPTVEIDPRYKVYAIEVKTLLHAVYFIFKGDAFNTMAWLSNFTLTRPESIINFVVKLNIKQFAQRVTIATTPFWWRGVRYDTTPDGLARVVEAYRNGVDMDIVLADNTRNPVELQAGTEDAIGIIGGIMGFFDSHSLVKLSKEDLIAANIQYTYLNNKGRHLEGRLKLFSKVLSMGARIVFNCDPFDQVYTAYTMQWAEIAAFTVQTSTSMDQVIKSRPKMLEVTTRYAEATLLLDNPLFSTIMPFYQITLRMRYKRLEELAHEASNLLKGTANRIEPLFLLFTGSPGVGKSAAIKLIQSGLCTIKGEEYSPELTYTFNGRSDYWEKYAQQPFVLMDDIFKEDDKSIRANEAGAIIGMVNTSTYALNMAFGEKGTQFFNSDYIFGSTNIANEGMKYCKWDVGMQDKQAVVRRFHIVVHREAPCEEDVRDNTFTIHQCKYCPAMVNKTVTTVQLTWLLSMCKQEQLRLSEKYSYSRDVLREMFRDGPSEELMNSMQNVRQIFPNPVLPAVEENEVNSDSDEEVELQHGGTTAEPELEKAQKQQQNEILKGLFERYADNMLVACWKEYAGEYLDMWLFIFAFLIFLSGSGFFLIRQMLLVSDKKESSSDSEEEKPTLQSPPGETKAQKWRPQKGSNKKKQHTAKKLIREVMKMQTTDDNYRMCLANKVAKCVVQLVFSYETTEGIMSKDSVGFHIKEGLFATVGHGMLEFSSIANAKVHMKWSSGEITTHYPDDFWQMDDDDMVCFRLPKKINLPPALFNYIVSSVDMHVIPDGFPMRLVSTNEDGSTYLTQVNKGADGSPVDYTEDGIPFVIRETLSYYGRTVGGQSGSIVTVEGPQGQVLVVGMHLGLRRAGVGLAIPICKEMFAIPEFGFQTQCNIRVSRCPHSILKMVDKQHFPPVKSRIHRTKLYGWNGTPIKIPARMKPFENEEGVVIDPMYLAMGKTHQEETPDTGISEATMEYIRNLYPRTTGTVISMEEALMGNPTKGSTSINLSTSAGYPYSFGANGKQPHIVVKNGALNYSEKFRKEMEYNIEQLKNGAKPEVYWADVLKDERLAIEKVKSGKARLFSACPLHYLILMRMWCLDYVTYIKSKCTTHPVAVGINYHSIEWTLLFGRLNGQLRNGGSVIAGDFSKYDGKVPKFVGKKFVEHMNWWYNDGPDNARIREVLFEHIHDAQHICYDFVYQVVDGNPSGNPFTVEYNSITNIMMTHTILTQDFNLRDDQFEMTVYGDDNITTTSLAGLRCSDFTEHFRRRFDMEYTHFSKTESDAHDTLFTVRYLSRLFVKDKNVYLAPLPLTTVVEMTYWQHGKSNEKTVLDTADSFFTELSHFSREVFEEYTTKYLAAVGKNYPELLPAISKKLKTYSTYFDQKYTPGKTIEFRSYGKFETQSSRKFTPLDITQHKSFRIIRILLWFAVIVYIVTIRPEGPKLFEIDHFPVEVTETNNTQFTDRAVNQIETTQHVELGNYQDAAPISTAEASGSLMQTVHQTTNMETFDINGALNREYVLTKITWTTDQAAGLVLGTYEFPKVLFDQPFIADKIKDFRYFKGAVRLTARMASSKFVYGRLLVDFQPVTNGTANTFTFYQRSGSPHIQLSASASEAVVFDVPFISQYRAIDLKNYFADEIGRFTFQILHPLTNIAAEVASAQVLVTAQFLDAEVFMPHDKVTVQSSRKGGEGAAKSKQGIVSSTLESVATLASYVEDVPLIGSYARTLKKIARPAAAVTKMLGLSKPTTVNTTQIIKIDPNNGMNYGKGIDVCVKIAMDPENQISTQPVVGGVSEDEMLLRYIAGTPQMVHSSTWLEASTPLVIMNTSRFDNNPTFVDNVSRLFKYISGSYKLKIYITASLMHAVRMVFWLTDSSGSDWVNCYHIVVDIQGDTEVEVTVPYCGQALSRAPGDNSEFQIYGAILSWSQPTAGANTPIFLNAYKAAAPDFQFGCLLEREFVPQSNPRFEFTKPFAPLHPSMTGFSHQNLLYGEEYHTMREVVHRYSAYTSATAGGGTLVNNYFVTSVEGGGSFKGLEMIGLFYRFWRGSIRQKAVLQASATDGMVIVKNGTDIICGTAIAGTNLQNLEWEVPYYDNKLFRFTNRTNDVSTTQIVSTSPKYLFKSAGDDFSFHWLVAPPPGTFQAVSNPSYGLVGFSTFVTAAP